jgi:hypothetical protein
VDGDANYESGVAEAARVELKIFTPRKLRLAVVPSLNDVQGNAWG